jgi:ribosomal protein S18 acetylase RimI-like enzyme
MHVRPATPADIAGVASLVQAYWAFESIPDFDPARVEACLRQLLAEPMLGACWVAQSEHRLCGYLIAVYVFSLEHGGLMAEIDEVYVAAEQRHSGCGSALLARAERDLTERGLVRLQLQLAVNNDLARNFYRTRGFTSRAGYEIHDKPLGRRLK